MFQRRQTRSALHPVLLILALSCCAAHAAISVLNTGVYTATGGSGGQVHTLSFNPGAATSIAVVVTAEASNGNPVVTFNGVAMTDPQPANASNVGFYYLNTPSTGGSFNLSFDYTAVSTVNFLAFAVVSLSASGDLVNTAFATDTDRDVVLTVPGSGSFVLTGVNMNNGGSGDNITPQSPLVDLFSDFLNSGGAGLSYVNNVNAGNPTYSYTATAGFVDRRISAMSFNVVPEPSLPVLVTLSALLLVLRRQRC